MADDSFGLTIAHTASEYCAGVLKRGHHAVKRTNEFGVEYCSDLLSVCYCQVITLEGPVKPTCKSLPREVFNGGTEFERE
jgi:hypothetical protein